MATRLRARFRVGGGRRGGGTFGSDPCNSHRLRQTDLIRSPRRRGGVLQGLPEMLQNSGNSSVLEDKHTRFVRVTQEDKTLSGDASSNPIEHFAFASILVLFFRRIDQEPGESTESKFFDEGSLVGIGRWGKIRGG